MADIPWVAELTQDLFASSSQMAARRLAVLGGGPRRLRYEWRSEAELAVERVKLRGFLVGCRVDDDRAREILVEVDAVFVAAATAFLSRPRIA